MSLVEKHCYIIKQLQNSGFVIVALISTSYVIFLGPSSLSCQMDLTLLLVKYMLSELLFFQTIVSALGTPKKSVNFCYCPQEVHSLLMKTDEYIKNYNEMC